MRRTTNANTVATVEGRRNLDAFNAALRSLMLGWRESAGLSQTALAAELGIDQAVVSRIEANRREVTVAEVFLWSEATGRAADETGADLARMWTDLAARPPSLWAPE